MIDRSKIKKSIAPKKEQIMQKVLENAHIKQETPKKAHIEQEAPEETHVLENYEISISYVHMREK